MPKNDQFPKITVEGSNGLSMHRYDNTKVSNNGAKTKWEKQDKNWIKNKDKSDKFPTLSFAQIEEYVDAVESKGTNCPNIIKSTRFLKKNGQ